MLREATAVVAVGSFFVALVAGEVQQATAATVAYDFEINLTSGTFAGQTGFGQVTYDDAVLTGFGEEIIEVDDGLSIVFNFAGQDYTEADDVGFDPAVFPSAFFNNGVLNGIDFVVPVLPNTALWLTNNASFSDPANPGCELKLGVCEGTIDTNGIFSASTANSVGAVTYVLVPEPATLAGLLSLSTLGIALGRKRKQAA
ncbi:hypothetical protein BST81_13305 [Leptolyngbya sp. 'hensonii']|nr:hypothetical protein BST81_13305 [Leptolyngbya sp. 'hensonii']